MIHTRLAAATLSSAAAAVLVGPLAAPAAADPAAANLALFAVARLWSPSWSTVHADVCADGWVDHGTPITGQWVFRIIGPTSTWYDRQSGPGYPENCHRLMTNGMPAGTADASITYVGVNGDVLADCSATLSWAPGTRVTWVGACASTVPPAPTP